MTFNDIIKIVENPNKTKTEFDLGDGVYVTIKTCSDEEGDVEITDIDKIKVKLKKIDSDDPRLDKKRIFPFTISGFFALELLDDGSIVEVEP